MELFIYGSTPMCKALKNAKNMFEKKKYNSCKKILIVFSDGDPTDGDPIKICEEMKN